MCAPFLYYHIIHLPVYFAQGARVGPSSGCDDTFDLGGALLFDNVDLVAGVSPGKGSNPVEDVEGIGGKFCLKDPSSVVEIAHGAVVGGISWVCGVLAQGAAVVGGML